VGVGACCVCFHWQDANVSALDLRGPPTERPKCLLVHVYVHVRVCMRVCMCVCIYVRLSVCVYKLVSVLCNGLH